MNGILVIGPKFGCNVFRIFLLQLNHVQCVLIMCQYCFSEDLVEHIEQIESTQEELESSVQLKDKELNICKETVSRMEEQFRKMEENISQFYDQDAAVNVYIDMLSLIILHSLFRLELITID